jgi:hypothetical protein
MQAVVFIQITWCKTSFSIARKSMVGLSVNEPGWKNPNGLGHAKHHAGVIDGLQWVTKCWRHALATGLMRKAGRRSGVDPL